MVCILSTVVSTIAPTHPMLPFTHVPLQILILEHPCELFSVLNVAKQVHVKHTTKGGSGDYSRPQGVQALRSSDTSCTLVLGEVCEERGYVVVWGYEVVKYCLNLEGGEGDSQESI